MKEEQQNPNNQTNSELEQRYNSLRKKIKYLRHKQQETSEYAEKLKLQTILVDMSEELTQIGRQLGKLKPHYEMTDDYQQDIGGEKGILKIQAFRAGEINEIINFLNDLQDAYANLYALDLKVYELMMRKFFTITDYNLSPIANANEIILPEDRLFILSVNIQSPGFWEVFGNLNPLVQIREYLKERHERRQDKEWREHQEYRKMVLENVNFETEILSRQIDLLKKANFSEQDIRRFIMKHYHEPLAQLNRHQDSGMIGFGEIVDIQQLSSTDSTQQILPFPEVDTADSSSDTSD
jgi:hypothetical protein